MLKILFAAFILASSVALADGVQVKITSFTMDNPQISKIGEVCGLVAGIPAGTTVKVTVTSDPNYNPGNYTTQLDQKNTFCTTIMTYTGTASATVWESDTTAAMPPVTSPVHGLRPR
jgi:hypothetical protein